MAPLVRKRLSTPPLVAQTVAFAAPVGLCVAVPRSRTRDVAVCALQMWAYLAAYKTPHDDEAAQRERVLVDYPIVVDRVLGLGELPTVRLQRSLARGQWRLGDRCSCGRTGSGSWCPMERSSTSCCATPAASIARR